MDLRCGQKEIVIELSKGRTHRWVAVGFMDAAALRRHRNKNHHHGKGNLCVEILIFTYYNHIQFYNLILRLFTIRCCIFS